MCRDLEDIINLLKRICNTIAVKFIVESYKTIFNNRDIYTGNNKYNWRPIYDVGGLQAASPPTPGGYCANNNYLYRKFITWHLISIINTICIKFSTKMKCNNVCARASCVRVRVLLCVDFYWGTEDHKTLFVMWFF